nr:MAG TPA: nucleoside triphosphate pyrophosphohydrolase [Caudoviricetes sp.]
MKQRHYQTIIEQAEQFGLENRLVQCTEEAGELIQALSKYRRIQQGDKTCRTDMCHAEYMIAEEMADIEICIKQLKYMLGNTEQIEQIKAEKIQRTEQRLLFGDTEEQRIKVTSAEIIVANTTGARQDKPYYEIKYQEVGQEEYTIGFGSYKLPYVLHWLDTCFEIIGEQNTDSISEVYTEQ